MLHTHHPSSWVGTVGQLVADVPSGLSLTSPQETKWLLSVRGCFPSWDHWVSGLCLSSGIIKSTTFRKLEFLPSSRWEGGRNFLFWVL
jgi:hypothetical protein